MSNKYLYVTLLSLVGLHANGFAQHAEKPPRLVISIHADELTTDLLETYSPLYRADGLLKLLNGGLLFSNGSFPFAPVDAASSAAAIATGATPYYNSITGTEWLNRTTLRPQSAIHDAQYGTSPQQLATSTLGDELKIATGGTAHVYAFAPSAECAILLAGHAADGAAWIEDETWQTTTYYSPQDEWLSEYTHFFAPSASVNNSIADGAISCIERGDIGTDEATDIIYVGLSLQPTLESYVQLDHTIARIVTAVGRKVPIERTLFVLTGMGSQRQERKEDRERFRIPTGKFYINRTANLLNLYLGAVYGNAQYIEACYRNQLFVNRQLIERKNIDMADLLRRSQAFILQLSGVRNVYTANQLMTSDSHLLARVRNAFNADRCGDLLIDIQPGWELVNEDAGTTSLSRVAALPFPIVFYGATIAPQRVNTGVTADRIAPTVARVIRIRAPNACMAEPLF
jgi:hypothetical protein